MFGDAPGSAGWVEDPRDGTTHRRLGEAEVRASTAVESPPWGAKAVVGAMTIRPATTPGPPRAAMAVE